MKICFRTLARCIVLTTFLICLSGTNAHAIEKSGLTPSDSRVFAEMESRIGVPIAIETQHSKNGTYILIQKNGVKSKVTSAMLPDQVLIAKEVSRNQLSGEADGFGDVLPVAKGADADELRSKLSKTYRYSYSYVIWKDRKGTSRTAKAYFRKLNTKMGKVFPLSGLPNTIRVGAVYKLLGKDPVKVKWIHEDQFTLESLPGHREGAGKFITFRIHYLSPSYRLSVSAQGPAESWQKSPIGAGLNRLFSYKVWSIFSCRIREQVVNRPCL